MNFSDITFQVSLLFCIGRSQIRCYGHMIRMSQLYFFQAICRGKLLPVKGSANWVLSKFMESSGENARRFGTYLSEASLRTGFHLTEMRSHFLHQLVIRFRSVFFLLLLVVSPFTFNQFQRLPFSSVVWMLLLTVVLAFTMS